MELFGLILSVPFLCVVSIVYSLIVKKVTDRFSLLIKPLLWISVVIVVLEVAEFVCVILVRSTILWEYTGDLIYPVHLVLFLSAVPALVNVMRLQTKFPFFSRWYVIGIICPIYGFWAVFLQIVVSEALFGIR